MLHPDTENHPQSNTSFRSLLAFKPRQLLIARHNPTTTITASASASKDKNSTKIASEMKATLHELILDYLHRNGFSKTLKRFHSEAQIQTDSWKASSLHLEDMFCKHNACDVDSNKNMCKKPGNNEATEKEKVCPTNEKTTTKKKKKKVIVETDDCAIKHKSEVTDKKIEEPSENLGQLSEDIIVDEQETKPKKKKSKHDLVSSTNDATNGSKIDDLTKKIKDKKKKKIEEVILEPSNTNEKELGTEVAQKEKKKKKKLKTDENGTIQPDVTKKEKKSSKKRKIESSNENENENENGSIETMITEESKRQKTETYKEEKSIMEIINAQETSNERFNGETNGKLEIDGVKSKKKQRNVTVEPKTVNAFQRVKIDEVEFAHDKLQDNSYWAKDGAEIGYGAKAQEVLGQVRGRDFRHEKTKKKRGSYRGLIDQESHSIKFTYSDED